jgi:hypothetical protein
VKEFIYPVSEVAAWTGRTGDVALRDLQDQCPDELGIHPDQKRWAVTYAGASAYVKRIIADDTAHERKMDAWAAANGADEQARQEHIGTARAKARDAGLKRRRPQLAYSGPGGEQSGVSMGRSPSEEARIRQAMAEAGDAAAAEWDRGHKPITLEQFEKTYKP